MQVRALSPSRSQSVTVTTGPFGTGMLGQPATWVRRHLALLATAELVVHLWGRLPGALAYAFACLLLLNHQMVRDVAWGSSGAVDREGHGVQSRAAPSPIFLVLSIVALTRVASLATGGFSTTWFGGFAFASVPAWFALRRFCRLCGAQPIRAWGDPSWQQALIAVAAVPLALAGVLMSHPRPALDWWDLSWQFWAMVFLFAASGVFDEIFYQAVVRPSLGDVMGTSGAAGCAFLYAITHADVELGLLLAMVVANVLFGLAVRRTGLLVGACTGRALFNVLIVLALPFWLPH
ncbi:MAG: CPBP family glutamic-type intramembrane protease [Nocardioidaceae bacterium]